MRYLPTTCALALLATGACATPVASKASQSEILATTKRLAANDCRPHSAAGARLSGCKYSARFIDGEWRVAVEYINIDKNGKRIYPFGASSEYVFDRSGKFITIIHGQ